MIDIKTYGNKIASVCPDLYLNNSFILYELPYIAILVIIVTLIAALSWRFQQQFGWNIYKKIGGDVEMRSKFLREL